MRVHTPVRVVALAAALALGLAACGGDGEDGGDGQAAQFDLVSEGTLTVCSDVPYAPFEMEDPDAPTGYTGFDIELMEEIADQLALEVTVVDSDFTAIQSGQALAAGDCDIAASAITITEEREQNVDFSEPYFDADQSLLVRAEDADKYETLEDLAGENIGVQADTTGAAYATENAPEGATVTEFPDAAALFAALAAGEIEAILQDFPVNAYRATQDDGVVVTATFETGEQYGFAVREEGSEELLEAVNTTLADLRDNGTYEDIFAEYFGEAPPAEGEGVEGTESET